MIQAFIILLILLIVYFYWRFIYFFRDPERITPNIKGSILSPADGTIIYIKEVKNNELPISVKKGRKITLDEFFLTKNIKRPGYLIGIFMHPTSVHVNRAPISGEIQEIDYKKGSNLPMTITWWRANLGLRPYEKYANHIVENERNIIGIKGKIYIFVVQIADIYVNRIESWVKKGENVDKGQRIGMIKFGSQVDLYIPKEETEITVILGQKVKAGETVIAKNRRV